MMSSPRILAAVAVLFSFVVGQGPTVAHAQATLDQNYDPTAAATVNAGFAGSNSQQERAQLFTVGLTGQMTQVDVFVKVFPPATGSLIIDVRAVVANAPDPATTPLGIIDTTMVPATSVPGGSGGFVPFVLSTPIAVTAGQKYVVTVRASAGASTFGWLGGNTNPYAGGSSFERVIGNHNWVPDPANFDLGFRTYVNTGGPAPPPPPPPVAGVTVTQSGGSTNVTEGGAVDNYNLVLNTAPTSNVTITLNPGTQVTVLPSVVTFTPANWNVAQNIAVIAVDDALVEGPHTGTITHTAASADPAYNGIAIANVIVIITDNDAGPPPPPPPPPASPPSLPKPGEGTLGGSRGPHGGEGGYGFGGGMHLALPLLEAGSLDPASSTRVVRNLAWRQTTVDEPGDPGLVGLLIAAALSGMALTIMAGKKASF